jgi:hypothetical protein
MKVYGWAGIILLAVAEFGMLRKTDTHTVIKFSETRVRSISPWVCGSYS